MPYSDSATFIFWYGLDANRFILQSVATLKVCNLLTTQLINNLITT